MPEPQLVRLSPYLLKEFNNRWFLMGYNCVIDKVQTVALDRIVAVDKDPEGVYHENTFFVPDEYLDSMVGVSRHLDSKTFRVTLKVDADQAPYVITKPLHVTQKVKRKEDDGSIVLTLDVICNLELERLILGYGCHIEVFAPRFLRCNIAKHATLMASQYQEKE